MNIALDIDCFPEIRAARAVVADLQEMIKKSGVFEVFEQAQATHDRMVQEHNEFKASILASLPPGLKVVQTQSIPGVLNDSSNNESNVKIANKIRTDIPATAPVAYTSDIDGIQYLFCDNLKLQIGKIQNQPAKGIIFIVEHLGIDIDYVTFYETVRNPNRGAYSSIRKNLTHEDKMKRGLRALNELYKLKGFSNILTLHTRKRYFFVTQKRSNTL